MDAVADRLLILSVCNVPAALLRTLAREEHSGSEEAFWRQIQHMAPQATQAIERVRSGKACPEYQLYLETCDWLNAADHRHLILPTHHAWPPRLDHCDAPPPFLFCMGDLNALHHPALAVVGARRATPLGLRHAYEFSQAVAVAGFATASGLALGIDSTAHRASLDAGMPTIAVLGSGLDNIYPRSNQDLAADIAENGVLISEFLPKVPPRRENFPRRNRLIAALSMATLVVEASLRSGSLITARLAGEMGREVYALPGEINNPYAAGCLSLIQNGANMIVSSEQLLEALGELTASTQLLAPHALKAKHAALRKADPVKLDHSAQAVLKVMEFRLMHLDEIAALTTLDLPVLAGILLNLELCGLIAEQGGSYQRLK